MTSKNINKVLEEINRKFKEKDDEIEKLRKNMEKEIKDKNKMKIEMKIMKDDIQNLKNMIGSIQVRDLAKTFMNQFKYLLNNNDKDKININKEEKWKIIRERVEKSFQEYDHSTKYVSFIELLRKSEIVIKIGNKEAHTIALEIYEKKICEIAEKLKLTMPNSNKLFFLIELGVSENSFKDGYQFLNDYFEDNMVRKFLRSNPFTSYFI